MSAKPPLSVIIPSHSRPDLLQLCLQSVVQHAPAGTQIIVIDDGSQDSVVSTLARTTTACQIIRFNEPRGFCVAANSGFAAARADIVQLLNDDTELASDVSSGIAAFADTTIAAVAPLVLRWPGQIIDSAGDSYDRGGFAQPRGRGQLPTGPWLTSRLVDAASACAAFYRREAVLAVGRFVESFGAYFEDVDLSLRLRHADYSIRYVPNCRVLHCGSASYGRPRGKLIEQQSRNEERLFWRNTNGSPAELLRHGVVLAGKTIRRISEGTLLPWAVGRLVAWRTEARAMQSSPPPANSTKFE